MRNSWISVLDELPGDQLDGDEFLVCWDNAWVGIATWDCARRFATNGWVGAPDYNVTHWQPLEIPEQA